MNLGMQSDKNKFKPTEPEIQLLEKLRRSPQMRERLEPILDLVLNPDGNLDAHQIEALLIVEMNKLGNQTLQSWAQELEQSQSQIARSQHPGLQQREKKTSDGGPPTDR